MKEFQISHYSQITLKHSIKVVLQAPKLLDLFTAGNSTTGICIQNEEEDVFLNVPGIQAIKFTKGYLTCNHWPVEHD